MRRATFVAAISVLTVAFGGLIVRAKHEQRPTPREGRAGAALHLETAPDGQIQMTIDPGNEPLATDYYARISAHGELSWDVETSTCTSLVREFLGYPDHGCAGLEEGSPAELSLAFPGMIESVRFFAPKISTVGSGTPPTELGWRKLVRLRPKNSSAAETAGVTGAYILFNFLQVPGQPVKAGSQNTQVMLVRETPSAAGYWAYWMLYDDVGNVTKFLQATFEDGATAAQGAKFYVPTACIECHGAGNEKSPYLTFLDVDHWLDRTQNPEEFTEVTNPLPDVSGQLATSEVMATIRRLNSEISAQNERVKAPPHVRVASASWVALHPNGVGTLPQHERGFSRAAADRVWSSSASDVALLRLLNRYCYRCHGTKLYNVFERQNVVRRRSQMWNEITAGRMPEDRGRNLPEPDRTALLKLLENLHFEETIETLSAAPASGRMVGSAGEEVAASYLSQQLRLAGLQPLGGDYLSTFPATVNGVASTGRNLIAVLPATVPAPTQSIVIGAHYDHLGADANGVMFPGADDNASGVASVLEVARRLRQKATVRQRDLVVAFWSGEEWGCIGSRAAIDMITKARQPAAYVNLDMVGRSDTRLSVEGISSSDSLEGLVTAAGASSPLTLDLVPWFGALTDVYTFANRGVPSLNFTTGNSHPDYHRTTDLASKIRYSGLGRITDLTMAVVASLLNGPAPIFQAPPQPIANCGA